MYLLSTLGSFEKKKKKKKKKLAHATLKSHIILVVDEKPHGFENKHRGNRGQKQPTLPIKPLKTILNIKRKQTILQTLQSRNSSKCPVINSKKKKGNFSRILQSKKVEIVRMFVSSSIGILQTTKLEFSFIQKRKGKRERDGIIWIIRPNVESSYSNWRGLQM